MMIYGVSYAKVKVICISHLHLDHFLGIFGLAETLRLSGVCEKIQIFGPVGLARVLESFGKKEIFEVHELHPPIKKSKTPIFTLNNYDFFAFNVSHGKIPALGYVVRERNKIRFFEKKAKSLGLSGALFSQILKNKKLKLNNKTIFLKDVSYVQTGKCVCYCGDTVFSKNCVSASKGCDLLIHECTYDDSCKDLAKERFHSTSSDSARVAKLAGAKSLLLTHISGKYSKDPSILVEQAKKIFKNTSVASDGLVISLK
jgi:ribonuclease Z